jgi:hypothetical protein
MCGHEALHVAPPCAVGRERTAGQHHLEDMEKLIRDLIISLVASVMKRNQDLVRQPPAVAGRDA